MSSPRFTPSSLFRKTKCNTHSIELFPKTGVSWTQIDEWLTANYTDDCKHHWNWRGFGKIETEEFSVVVVKKPNYRHDDEACVCAENTDDEDEE